ncbi:MAG: hypothetical protein BAA01_06040 [Bacillus thermozeamaize]|uniref:Uncharacterized protein n=1 Tax=Bacillus thermozeamaize TaxID=230954 RepID=A0A1Y3PEX0_9BACI|nr:MAG: hypothetical protein BAA01_06040 [Bacillus thermozeamaize]
MCPLCGTALKGSRPNSLICANRHCFDLSKPGYVHLLARPARPTKYGQQLFESRLAICRSGFFHGIVERIHKIITYQMGNIRTEGIHILDAGCGEGSLLAELTTGLNHTSDGDVLGVGMDIAKAGIRIASREYPGLIWCVADLARSPFMDKAFDVILNILSPSNYSEFSRMLDDDGILIKIAPGSEYLKELRTLFFGQSGKQAYSNQHVVTHFCRHFNLIDKQHVQYRKRLDQTLLTHLINMTPLSWGATEGNLQQALQSGISFVTVDATILVGKKQIR